MKVNAQTASSLNQVGLLVRLKAKPGKEQQVEEFLRAGLKLVEEEPATSAWFALRIDEVTFGIFDTFPNETGRQAHFAGKVAAALFAQAPELFSEEPIVEKLNILAVKLPSSTTDSLVF